MKKQQADHENLSISYMGWTMVTIESDCLVVVQMIRSSAPMRSRIGQVVQECREIIKEANNLKLYFIKRSANMLAHELAHVSHMYPDRSFDGSSVPVNVRDCIRMIWSNEICILSKIKINSQYVKTVEEINALEI